MSPGVRMSRRTALSVGLAACVSALAACGVPLERRANTIQADDLPEGLRPSDTSIPVEPVDQESIDVWLVRDDKVARTRHRIPLPVTADAALAELLVGPTELERNRSLRSAIPDPAAVLDVAVLGGVATVELAQTFAEIPAGDQVLAVAQIVLTLTDLRGVGRVRFVVDEVQVAVPLPNGDAAEGSVSRDDYIALVETTIGPSS
jgi:germination protein M